MVPVAGFEREPREMPRGKAVLGKRTKEEQKVERKALGSLRSRVVAPKTESRYLVAVSHFPFFSHVSQKTLSLKFSFS